MKFEIVSKDKRCGKTRTKEKDIDFFLQRTVPMRMFEPDDVL